MKQFRVEPGVSGFVSVSDGLLNCSAAYTGRLGTKATEFGLFAFAGNFRGELVEEVCAVTRCTPGAPYCIGW